jgi:hypothetical protein
MSQIQASRATKASLQQPFHIYYSPVALVFTGLIVTFSAALFGLVTGIMLIVPGQSAALFEKSKATGAWVIIVMALVSLYLFYTRVLRPWLNFRKPVITISLDGIAVRGRPPLAWRNLERNVIRTIYSSSGPAISILRLRGKDGQKIGVYFGDLKVSTEDYERLCVLYQAESEQRLEVAA